MDLDFWTKALKDAERELEAATTPSALNGAAKRLMRAKAELKRHRKRGSWSVKYENGGRRSARVTLYMARCERYR